MPKSTSNDFDRDHTIPSKIKNDHYIYTAGGRSDEVVRYWLLSNDAIVEVPSHTKTGKPKKEKMTVEEYFNMEERPALYLVQIAGIRNHTVNKIAPQNKSELAELMLTHTIASTPTSPESPPELRKNYKIVKRYTQEDLDRMEEFIDE